MEEGLWNTIITKYSPIPRVTTSLKAKKRVKLFFTKVRLHGLPFFTYSCTFRMSASVVLLLMQKSKPTFANLLIWIINLNFSNLTFLASVTAWATGVIFTVNCARARNSNCQVWYLALLLTIILSTSYNS